MIIAVIISLICHMFCFSNIELIVAQKPTAQDSSLDKIYFLGGILKPGDYHLPPAVSPGYPADRLAALHILNALERNVLTGPGGSPAVKTEKPALTNLNDEKKVYLDYFPTPKTKQADSSIMFYPPMPYHFLLYFKDRQIAHVEVAFYISPEGRVMGIKRKISSGNPEVDLLIMRNLTHFLNLCESNLTPGSWQIVKIDLSP